MAIPPPAQLPILGRYVSRSSTHSRDCRSCEASGSVREISMAICSLFAQRLHGRGAISKANEPPKPGSCDSSASHLRRRRRSTSPTAGTFDFSNLALLGPRRNPRSVAQRRRHFGPAAFCPLRKRASSSGFDFPPGQEKSVPKFAALVCMAYGLALVVFVARHPGSGSGHENARHPGVPFGQRAEQPRPSECAASPCSATTRTAEGREGHQKHGATTAAVQEGNILKNYGFGPEAARRSCLQPVLNIRFRCRGDAGLAQHGLLRGFHIPAGLQRLPRLLRLPVCSSGHGSNTRQPSTAAATN